MLDIYCCWSVFNRTSLTPKPIDALSDKRIVNIICGSSHSAAITDQGDLYTWGKGARKLLGKIFNIIVIK